MNGNAKTKVYAADRLICMTMQLPAQNRQQHAVLGVAEASIYTLIASVPGGKTPASVEGNDLLPCEIVVVAAKVTISCSACIPLVASTVKVQVA